jgi:hypothetical protein
MARAIVHELETISALDEYFEGKVRVFFELIRQHFEEEEKETLPSFSNGFRAGLRTTRLLPRRRPVTRASRPCMAIPSNRTLR